MEKIYEDDDMVTPVAATPVPAPAPEQTKIYEEEEELAGGWQDMLLGGTVDTFQSLTANWGDEILAGLAAPFGEGDLSSNYAKNKAKIKAYQKYYEDNAGAWSNVNKLAASALPISGGAKLFGGGLRGLSASGGLYGGLEYAGEKEGSYSNEDILPGGGQVAVGAIAGPAVQVGGQAVGDFINKVWPNATDHVKGLIQKFLDDTGLTPEQLVRRQQAMGPNASVVDATDEYGVGTAQGVVQYGGIKSRQKMSENMQKINEAKNNIRASLQKATGKGEGRYYTNLDDIKSDRRTRAKSNYGEALNKQFPLSPKMRNIIERNPNVREAWENVRNRWADEGRPIPEMYKVDNDGKVIDWNKEQMPNAEMMQELKWEMDRMYNTLKGSLDSQGGKDAARLWQDRNTFKTEMYRLNPEIKKADKIYAGDMAVEAAMDKGKKLGFSPTDHSRLMYDIDNMSLAERDAFLTGAVDRLYNRLGASREEALGALNDVESRNALETLRKLVGTDEANRILKTIKNERRFRQVHNAVLGNSQTAQRLASGKEIKERMSSTNEYIEQIRTQGLIGNTVAGIIELATKNPNAMTRQQLVDFGDLLTKAGGAETMMKRLQETNAPKQVIRDFANTLAAFMQRRQVPALAAAGLYPALQDSE